jgi:RimJ/RimL family protein N-acetyltransferase
MEGIYCRLEALSAERHGDELFSANTLDGEGRMWTYLPYGPFQTPESYAAWLQQYHDSGDPAFFAIIDKSRGQAVGVACYMRIEPVHGNIEVAHLAYSPLLQRTTAATEAMYLMMKRVFDLGYRRYEWKCNALNSASRAAAQRLGFSFEGIFRQAAVIKGRSRDTAWYSIIDEEWPALQRAYLQWLAPANFDEQGRQRQSLARLMEDVVNDRREASSSYQS